jgi:gliding motility-associated-like protein/uncharacterized repeat protein (TIGR01451 family)
MVDITTTVPSDLTVCGVSKTFTVKVYNPSPNLLTNIVLTVTMPTGMRYDAGSITGATDFNITNLSAPQFSITDIATLTTRNLTFTASAVCDIMAFLSAGNPALNQLRIDYRANGNNLYDTHTTYTYSVKQPNLSITTVTNQSYSGNVGDTYQRCITVTNGGLGELSTFVLTDVHGNGIQINSVDKGSRQTQGASEIIILSGNDFTSIGNGNNLFESGESITICESVTVTNCVSVQSAFTATWGCHLVACQGSGSSANVVFPNLTPNLTVTHQPSQSACYGLNVPNQQQLTIVNNGAGTATNVVMDVFQSTGSVFYQWMTSYIDANSFTYQVGAGPVVPVSATVVAANAAYACLGPNRPGSVSVNLPDIASNQTVYLRWNTYTCCHDYCNGSPHAGTNNGWSYKGSYSNVCQNNYVVPTVYARGYNQMYVDLVDNGSPATIVSGQTLTYKFLFSNDIINYTSTANRQWRFRVVMPNCVTYAGNARVVANNGTSTWNPSSVTTAGNILTIVFTGNQPFNRINGDLRFDLTANCGGGCTGGASTLRVESYFVNDPSCACVHSISCVNLPMNVVCPTTCPGMTNTGFTISRTSYGLKDDNNDGVAEPGAVNLSLIRTDRAMYGDTITSVFSGNVMTGAYPHLYAQSRITNGNNYLTYLDGVLTITRGATVYTCNIAAPTVTNAGNVRTFNYDLSASVLIASGCVPLGFVYQNGDVVQFRPRYKVSRNTGGAILLCEATNEFYNSIIPNPTNAVDKLSCNSYTGSFSIIGYYYTNWGPDSYSASSCNQITVSQNYYLSIGPCCQQYAGGNLFPFEYRSWAWAKNLIVTPPAGYTFVSAQFNHTRTAGSAAVSTSAWQTVTPVNANLPSWDFPVEQYFSRQGGAFMESDDGFYGTLQVTMTPSCGVVPNVESVVGYNWIFGESPIMQGTNSTNNVNRVDQDFITYQGPDLFIQSLLPSIIAQNATAAWDVSISNTTNIDAHNVFITAPQVSGVSVVEVFDVTNNVVVTPTAGGIYQLGQLAGNAIRNLRITGTYTSCAADTIIVHAGWNCLTYPTNLAAYPCSTDKIKLTLTPQIATLIANITSPSSTVLLCDTASYTVEGVNIQLGTAYDLKLRIILPLGVAVFPGSSSMSYPPGSPFVSIPNPTFISGTTYEWDLSALNATLGTDGLKGILQNLLNAVKVRFGVRTNCSYTSGSLIAFNFNGRSACGLYTGQEVTLSSQLGITGADKPYETKVDLISTYISPCVNSTSMTVNIVNNGPLATGPSDSVVVVFPPGISYITGTYSGIRNAPPNVTFRTYNLNNKQYVQWKLPQNIAAGDSIRFSFSFSANAFTLDCNIQDFEAYTISNKNLLCVLNGITCGVNVRTGDTILPMYVYKANLSFTNITATAVQNGTSGERLSVELDILNIGENIGQGNNTIVGFYRDVDGNGVKSPADILLKRDTISAAINNGATYNHTTLFNVSAGNGCNLIAYLDTVNNGCICNPAQIFIDNIPLYNAGVDKELCSGSTIQIGGQPVNGYQYTWNPATGLSSPNTYNTNFSLQNLTGANDVIIFSLTTNRINCTSSDTMQVTVFPQTNVSFSGLTATYCSNDAIAPLTGNPLGGTFTGNSISGNDFNPATAGAGVISIIYTFTDANNCTWRDTQQTTVYTAPVVSFTGFLGGYCFDAPAVTLTGNPSGGTFSGNGISGNNFIPSVAGAGNHNIVYSFTDANQCTDTDTQTVRVNPLPVVTFTGLNPEYCVNEPAAILIPNIPGGLFTGTGINNGNNFEPRIAGAGNFTIFYSYRDQFQCADTDTQTVIVHPLTPTTFSGLNNQYCIDAPVATLTGNPSGGAFTGNGINGNDFTPASAGTGFHFIRYTFTDANNCTNKDSLRVRVDALPVVNFTGLATAYCIDAPIAQLNGNQPSGMFSGNGISGTRFIPTSTGVGQHTIIFSYTDGNNCFNADTQQTTVNALPVVSFSGLNTDYCEDAPAVTLTGNPSGGTFSGNGISGNDFTPSIATVGNHKVKYSYTDANNCFAADSMIVAVHPVPEATAVVNNISCFGANDGNISLIQTDGTPLYQYNWNNGAYNTQNIFNLTENNYDVLITDAEGCTFTASYSITEPDSLVSSIQTKDAVCYNDANGYAVVTLSGGTLPYSFSWSNGLTDSSNYSLIADSYTITVSDANQCSYVHSFIINEPQPVWINVTPSFDSLAYGNSVQLTTEYFANGFPVTYVWEPTEGLGCTHCPDPVASPLQSTLYTVTLTDSTGCVAADNSMIVIKNQKVFYAPNIFSPNGDGINDEFRIYVEGVKKFYLNIYDRWGENVFATEDVKAAWNGTINGKELQPAVYVFDVYILFKDNETLKHRGSVTLVR